MRVRVEIKKEHIANAIEGPAECPVALALTEALGERVWVYDDGTFELVDRDPGLDRFHLPRSGHRIVRRFDNEQAIQPCSIFPDIPEEVLHAHHG